MVNRGVSRACGTCKERRKKCDETRPKCNACVRANRECLGYSASRDLIFRHHAPGVNGVRNPGRISRDRPRVLQANHLTDDELEARALEYFVRDYCVRPVDPIFSRGYLQKVSSIVQKGDGPSMVVEAARILALGGLGRRMGRVQLRRKARQLYLDQLTSFRSQMLDDNAAIGSEESVMIVALFGLYEIMSASFPEDGEHGVHALGITAILRTHNSPIGLVADLAAGSPHALLKASIMTPPHPNVSEPTLDSLTLQVWPVFAATRDIFYSEGVNPARPYQLRDLALDAQRHFDASRLWAKRQDVILPPQFAGIAEQTHLGSSHGSLFWPGQVLIYRDLWIAMVWMIYYKASIMLANIVAKCAVLLPEDEELQAIAARVREDVQPILADALASIPFFLLGNVKSAFGISETPKPLQPGPPIGGLLALHPLHLIAHQEEIVNHATARHVRGCLRWIDEYLGVGQARLMAQDTPLSDLSSVANAHTIIWAGIIM